MAAHCLVLILARRVEKIKGSEPNERVVGYWFYLSSLLFSSLSALGCKLAASTERIGWQHTSTPICSQFRVHLHSCLGSSNTLQFWGVSRKGLKGMSYSVVDPECSFQLVSDLYPDPTWILSNILSINFTFVFPSVCVLGCILNDT